MIRPLSLALAALAALPSRTQITRHDCVKGWRCTAKWQGVPLGTALNLAQPKKTGRSAVFHCYNAIERSPAGAVFYHESIDPIDADHAQTILFYAMNGAPLPVANGAPLRLWVERQLGCKMAKYIHRIELEDTLIGLGFGKESYWVDRGLRTVRRQPDTRSGVFLSAKISHGSTGCEALACGGHNLRRARKAAPIVPSSR